MKEVSITICCMQLTKCKRFVCLQRRHRHFKSGQATVNKRSLVHVERGGRGRGLLQDVECAISLAAARRIRMCI